MSAERTTRERLMPIAREQLGDEAFLTAWAKGAGLPLERAVAHALDQEGSGVRRRYSAGGPSEEIENVAREAKSLMGFVGDCYGQAPRRHLALSIKRDPARCVSHQAATLGAPGGVLIVRE